MATAQNRELAAVKNGGPLAGVLRDSGGHAKLDIRTLLLSRFEGIANLDLLPGSTLSIAGIAVAFLTPVLVKGVELGLH